MSATGAPKDAPERKSGKNGPEKWLAQFDSESSYERCDAQAAIERLGLGGREALTDALAETPRRAGRRTRSGLWPAWVPDDGHDLVRIARSDPEPSVRSQAVRAGGPRGIRAHQHRLNAGSGDADFAMRLAALGEGQDSRVLLESSSDWPAAGRALRLAPTAPGETHAALAHAGMQAMRRSETGSQS